MPQAWGQHNRKADHWERTSEFPFSGTKSYLFKFEIQKGKNKGKIGKAKIRNENDDRSMARLQWKPQLWQTQAALGLGRHLLGWGSCSGVIREKLAYLGRKHHMCAVDMDGHNGTAPSNCTRCHSSSSCTVISREATTKWVYRPWSGPQSRHPSSQEAQHGPGSPTLWWQRPFLRVKERGKGPRKRCKSDQMNIVSTFVPF